MDVGSAGSWVRDAIVAGTLSAPVALITLLWVDVLARGGAPEWRWVEVAAEGSAAGAVLGAALAVPGWAAARRLPLGAAQLLGVPVGALGGLVTLLGFAGGWSPDLPLDWAALGGAAVLTPPWAVYVAVRARGRSGLAVACAVPVWAMTAIAPLMLAAEFLA